MQLGQIKNLLKKHNLYESKIDEQHGAKLTKAAKRIDTEAVDIGGDHAYQFDVIHQFIKAQNTPRVKIDNSDEETVDEILNKYTYIGLGALKIRLTELKDGLTKFFDGLKKDSEEAEEELKEPKTFEEFKQGLSALSVFLENILPNNFVGQMKEWSEIKIASSGGPGEGLQGSPVNISALVSLQKNIKKAIWNAVLTVRHFVIDGNKPSLEASAKPLPKTRLEELINYFRSVNSNNETKAKPFPNLDPNEIGAIVNDVLEDGFEKRYQDKVEALFTPGQLFSIKSKVAELKNKLTDPTDSELLSNEDALRKLEEYCRGNLRLNLNGFYVKFAIDELGCNREKYQQARHGLMGDDRLSEYKRFVEELGQIVILSILGAYF